MLSYLAKLSFSSGYMPIGDPRGIVKTCGSAPRATRGIRYGSAYVPCRHSVLSSGAAKLNTFRTPATSPSVGPAHATSASTQRHRQSAGEAVRVTGRVTALEPGLVDPAAAEVVAVREESDVGDKTA